MVWTPCLVRSTDPGDRVPVRLGHALVDEYLEFVAARCRPNTVLATAYDLKVFFSVVGREPSRLAGPRRSAGRWPGPDHPGTAPSRARVHRTVVQGLTQGADHLAPGRFARLRLAERVAQESDGGVPVPRVREIFPALLVRDPRPARPACPATRSRALSGRPPFPAGWPILARRHVRPADRRPSMRMS